MGGGNALDWEGLVVISFHLGRGGHVVGDGGGGRMSWGKVNCSC